MGGLGRLTQEERKVQFDAFREGDAADNKDVVARVAVVLICGVVLWFVTDQTVMLIWGFGYLLLTIALALFLRRNTDTITAWHLNAAVIGSITVATWYCAMVV